MRNLSFYEPNNDLLADELVIKFLCVVIRHLGTRNMLLRDEPKHARLMKDIIIFLSNLAQKIELPGREQALCLLHFLLAFAPNPQPNIIALSVFRSRHTILRSIGTFPLLWTALPNFLLEMSLTGHTTS